MNAKRDKQRQSAAPFSARKSDERIDRPTALTVVFLAAGILVHGYLGFLSIRAQSPTFDEPLHLAAGAAYWKTRDYRVNGMHHPPLTSMMAALPVLAFHPTLSVAHPQWEYPQWNKASFQYGFADWFFYRGDRAVSPEKLMTLGRSAILFLSCLFLVGLFAAAWSLYGPVAAWAAFLVGVFSPSLLAHGSLVTTDFLFTAFYFFFFICFGFWEREPLWRWAILSGVCLGLSFCSKFSAVAIGPVLALWLLKRGLRIPFPWRQILMFLGAAAAVVLLVYQFMGLPMFLAGLDFTLGRVQAGRSTFLMGHYSLTGWWYYFPMAFLIKTPLPVIAGVMAAAVMAWKKKIRLPWFLFLPPAVYFTLACMSSVQIGYRYVLPIEPFLCLALGAAVGGFWSWHGAKTLCAGLALWLAAGTLWARPFFLSYFNEMAGGPSKGYRYLTDSNIDWGQGLLALRNYMREAGVRKIYLSYFGTADPAAYGIDYSCVAPYGVVPPRDPDADLRDEPKIWLAISATNYQSTYFDDRHLFSWLKAREPLALVGGSILIFDIGHDPESHRRLADIFDRMGKTDAARRERAWTEKPGV